MSLAGELAKYAGGELAKAGGKELAKAGATSALSSILPSLATKVGTEVATKSALNSLVPAVTRKLASGIELGTDMIPMFRGQMNTLDKLDYNKGLSPNSNGFFMTPNKSATDSWAGKGVVSVDADPNDIMTLSELSSLRKDAEKYMSDPKFQMQLYNENPDLADIYDAVYASDNYQSLSKLTNKPFIERDGGQGTELGEVVFFPDTRPELTAQYNNLLASGKNQWATPAAEEAVSSTSVPAGTKVSFNKDLSIKSVDKPSMGRGWFASNENNPHIAKALKQSGADKYLGEPNINLAEEPGITIYHGTPNTFEDFDESLPSVWFSDSDKNLRDTGLSIRGGQPMNIMKRELPKNLNIADEDLADRLTKLQLKARGYDGVAYTESGPNGDETYYEIFKPNKTLKKIPDTQKSGVELSPQQQEFFKNSVVRDANGNLKVLYHGSPNGEFYEFNKDLANPESDWGKGFYFTDNELDVKNNYVGGGPDFENKVARRAEQLEDELDISYEKAEEQARKELLKGGYQISAYANMEDPAIVGKTFLFDGSEYGVKPLEDYDNIDDYYNDLIYDLSDDVINDTNIDYAYKDDLMRIMSEAYYDGGIGLQELKDKLAEMYIEDYDGNLVGNDVARSIIENLGFDGIIDPTVSSKFNMDMEDGTTHYIMFNPEQVKNISNSAPTKSKDIRYAIAAALGIGSIIGPYMASQKDVDNIE